MKLIYTILLTFAIIYGQAQSCCSASATEQFAALVHDPAFKASHEEPLPFTFTPKGEMISFSTADGKNGSAYFLKSPDKTDHFLFVFHEWWGLNDYIRQEAEKLQAGLGNVNVLAIDLYDGRVADTREKAAEYMNAVKKERAENIINGAVQYAGRGADISTIGWCFGGSWSLQAALLAGDRAEACVIYYGMPEKDVNRLKTLKAPVLGIFANKDQFITPAVVKEFESNMKTAGKKVTIHQYEADHAFANPSNPKYDKAFADDAHQKALQFLKSED